MAHDYILEIKQTVTGFFKDDDVRIILFGSRARNDNCRTSDVDIGIISPGKVDIKKITLLREKIDNLNIPFKIEIVNFSEVSEDFKEEALKGSVVWKN